MNPCKEGHRAFKSEEVDQSTSAIDKTIEKEKKRPVQDQEEQHHTQALT